MAHRNQADSNVARARERGREAEEHRRQAEEHLAAIARLKEQIDDLVEDTPRSSDARVYPRWFAPVLIWRFRSGGWMY